MDSYFNTAHEYKICKFGNDDTLTQELEETIQVKYLISYLKDQQTKYVLEEKSYFDRDYLAEFSVFYSISSRGYLNTCRRLHFFSGENFSRELFTKSVSGNQESIDQLQECYLGFTVIRPIPKARLGRTILRWYKDPKPNNSPRVISPARKYYSHIAGIKLEVYGLAWQQQDTAVASCATIGIWSMLHSSAFDDHHSIPTTVEITKQANKINSYGGRVFPSKGLTVYQVAEAIKENNLSPIIIEGTIPVENRGYKLFTKERFASSCASFIRSGYPVLVAGYYCENNKIRESSAHAIVAVGFRENITVDEQNDISLIDSEIEYFFMHDDNIGANTRFKLEERIDKDSMGSKDYVSMKISPPSGVNNLGKEFEFSPTEIVVAVHNDLRLCAKQFHYNAIRMAQSISFAYQKVTNKKIYLTVGTRYIKLADYLGTELKDRLGKSEVLGKTRLEICERLPPMSLHIGVIRIASSNSTPLIDVLCDTTDSDINHPVYGHVVYNEFMARFLNFFLARNRFIQEDFETQICAF